NCCGITIGDELISKIQYIPLELICSICDRYLLRNPDANDFAQHPFFTTRLQIEKLFFRTLMNSYNSNNGLFFCINYYENYRREPLKVINENTRLMLYDELFGFEESINNKLERQVDYFSELFTLLCMNLVSFAKINHLPPLEAIEDYGEIFAFRIFNISLS
ncbi:MAG: hypothetical protein MHMPM18_003327, partial [Marteilia pararefringens]